MTLSALLKTLASRPNAALSFHLPDGSAVPAHFHVTEVGRMRKDFIDCGGTVRSVERCILQVWVADDLDHRVTAGKLAKIIGLARPLLGEADLQMEVEYDVGVITQMPVVAFDANNERIALNLGGKHTACLAPDRCGVADSACAAPGCCAPPGPAVSLGVRR